MTGHTPGPWRTDGGYYIHTDTESIAHVYFAPTSDTDKANAARIVACVNACEGIEDPAAALAEVRAALRHIVGAGDAMSARVAEQALALLDTSKPT